MILDAWGWCIGTTQRDGMGREEERGFRMGNTCIPVADSFWYMAKPIQYCKGKLNKIFKKWKKKKKKDMSDVSCVSILPIWKNFHKWINLIRLSYLYMFWIWLSYLMQKDCALFLHLQSTSINVGDLSSVDCDVN